MAPKQIPIDGDPVELRGHVSFFFFSTSSVFLCACCMSVGTAGYHSGAIEISGSLACSLTATAGWHLPDQGHGRFVLRRQDGGFWHVISVPGGLESVLTRWTWMLCSFDVLRCTHRILETILNLRHCRVTSKLHAFCDTVAVYVKMTAGLERLRRY